MNLAYLTVEYSAYNMQCMCGFNFCLLFMVAIFCKFVGCNTKN